MSTIVADEPKHVYTPEAILAEVQKNGFLIMNNFIDEALLAKIQQECEWFLANSRDWYKKRVDDHSSVAIVCPQTIPLEEKDRIAAIYATFAQPLFAQTSRRYLNDTVHVNTFIIDRQSSFLQPITEWHADQQQDGLYSFKFMLYFNHTTDKNGAFSYVPGSHRVIRTLLTEAEARGISNRKIHHFHEIKQLALELGLASVSAFLNGLDDHIKGDYESDNVYSLNAPRGSLIAFDPKGIHRGGVVREGERFLVRFHCYEARLSWKDKLKRLLTRGNGKNPFFPVGSSAGRTIVPIKEYG